MNCMPSFKQVSFASKRGENGRIGRTEGEKDLPFQRSLSSAAGFGIDHDA